MSDASDATLRERVEALERTVAALQSQLDRLSAAPTPQAPPLPPERKATLTAPAAPPRPRQPALVWRSENGLKILGIGLLLFGVGFLFKYSVDQGWLTEWVRVGIGLLLGAGLLVLGLRLAAPRPAFGPVLLGGGIAVFYITGYAAFQRYGLVSHGLALAFMSGATLLAFALARRQQKALLAIVGTVGGLGTPFLLHSDEGSLQGLVTYTCLVLAGAGALYLSRGWRSLVWTAFAGGWAIFLLASLQAAFSGSDPDMTPLRAGVAFAWLAFGGLPVLRALLARRNPERWPPIGQGHVHALVALSALVALLLSQTAWSLSEGALGYISLAGAGLYAAIAANLRDLKSEALAYTHALVALSLLTFATCLLLSGQSLFVALAAEALVLHLVSHRLQDRGTAIGAHALFLVVALWFVYNLFSDPTPPPLFNVYALSDLAVLLATVGASLVLWPPGARPYYRLAAHLGLLGWLLRELYASGQGYVSLAWGLYAIALLVSGLRGNHNSLVLAAMATLLLVVGKLFLIDLVQLDALWRILLFLGFGGLFLLLSYYFQALWRKPAGKPTPPPDTTLRE